MIRKCQVASVTLCLIGMLWLGMLWPKTPLFFACRIAAGLTLAFFWSGALLLQTRLRPERMQFGTIFHFLSAGVALSIGTQILVLSSFTALGGSWTPFGFVVAQTGLAALATACSLTSFRPRAFSESSPMGCGRTMVTACVGAAIIVSFVVLTFRPRGFSEGRYWPLEAELLIRDLRPASQVKLTYGPQWERIDTRTFCIRSDRATAMVESLASSPVSTELVLLVEGHREGEVEIVLDGEPVASEYLHPRFDSRRHARNYPPPNVAIRASATIAPGAHELSLSIAETAPQPEPGGHLIVTDLTGLDARSAREVFDRRYLIANVGDTRENIELARSLFAYPYPRETSYAGEIFDGGGYAISNLPLPYYVYAPALLASGDLVIGLGWLHVAMLVGIWLSVRALVRLAAAEPAENQELPWAVEVLCLLSVLAYAVLMRFMIESIYIHTTLTLAFLVAAYHLVRGHRGSFLVWAVFATLTKGGALLIGLLLAVAAIVGPRPRRGVLRLCGWWLVLCVAFGLGLLAFGGLTGSLQAWRDDFVGDDYAGRFHLIGEAAGGDAESAALLGRAAWELTKHVAAAGGYLALLCVAGVDWLGALLGCTGVLFHALVCASDPPYFESWGHTVHPLNYFTPASSLLAVAGLRSLRKWQGRRSRVAVSSLLILASVLGIVWCRHRSETYGLSESMGADWRAMHAACINDGILRRAQELLLKHRDMPSARRDAQRVLDRCGRTEAGERLTRQKSKAHYTLAVIAVEAEDYGEARAQLEAMRQTWPESDVIYRQCIEALPEPGDKPTRSP